MRRRADEEKEKVKAHPPKLAQAMEQYANELVSKQKTLGELQKDLSQLVRKSNIVEVFRNHSGNTKKLQDARSTSAGACSMLKEMVVAPTGYYF